MSEMKPYEVYIKTDNNGNIIAVNSSAFLSNITDWIKIDEGYGDKYHHAQGNYFPDSLYDFEHMIPQYKYVDGKVIKRTEEEIQADIPKAIETPSQLDIIEAQVAYTAMMTDTLLEG